MPRLKPTIQAKALHLALLEKEIDTELEKWDEHKHIDISIPSAKLYIEIDGIQHYTNASIIKSDFTRDNYSSEDGYDTFRVPNEVIDEHLDKVVSALQKVVKDRKSAPLVSFERG